jgi:nitrogen regulation protein NR(I)
MKPVVLVVDDEPNLRTVLSANLRLEDYHPLTAVDGADAIEVLKNEIVHVVISDIRMPNVDGMALLNHITDNYPFLPIIMITAHGTVDTAVEAMKLGAFDYITKPFDQDELKLVLRKAVATSQYSMADGGTGRYGIVAATPSMQEIFDIIDRVADTPSTILISGESGTGKELVSRALHEHSSRSCKPFIRIHCAAIPKDLIESELFGYEKGAFTGAVSRKPGRFELADEGTLFLDEIGEIPQEMQVKLLRALQEQEFERVGGIRTLKVDVRLIAATNQDLDSLVKDGRFREDLYYRLNVVPIRLPALRERKEDIPLLSEHIIKKYNERLKKNATAISDTAMNVLMAYNWPGNIRELENVLERMMLFAKADKLEFSDVPIEIREHAQPMESVINAATAASTQQPVGPLKELVKETTVRLEQEFIIKALKETKGNVTRAAKILQISRKSLQNKMKEFGLRDSDS